MIDVETETRFTITFDKQSLKSCGVPKRIDQDYIWNFLNNRLATVEEIDFEPGDYLKVVLMSSSSVYHTPIGRLALINIIKEILKDAVKKAKLMSRK